MSDLTLMELFRQEIEIQVATFKAALTQLRTWRSQPNSPSDALFPILTTATQAIHAIWGSYNIAELTIGTQLAQRVKDCLIAAQNQTLQLGDEELDVLVHAGDLLVSLSKATNEGFEAWMSEHTWELNITQRTLINLLTAPVVVTPVQEAVSSVPSSEPLTTPEEPLAEPLETPKGEGMSMMELFRLEVEAQVAILTQGLLGLESNPQSSSGLEALMRAAHSLKGAARIVNLEAAVHLAHAMEDCFVAAQKRTITLNPDSIDVLLHGVDLLQSITQVSDAELTPWLTTHQGDFEQARIAIASLLNPNAAPVASLATVSQPLTPVSEPSPPKASNELTSDRVVRVSADNLNRIMGLAGELLIEANWLQPFADSMVFLKSRLVELFRRLEQLQEAIEYQSAMVHDLEAQQSLETLRHQEQECLEFFSDRLDELEQYARRTVNLSDRLYQEVISSHMRPFADGVQGFPRMIRDLARKLNKQVKLEILGKSTPVDRDILKKLEAPLTHILRNAVDHGLELPQDRLNAAKPSEGTIRLEAFHRGGMLAIAVTDDGRGIDPEHLRQKVINKNLVTPEMATQLSDTELMDFLFLPGFSTAKQVTEISGRGVGLDIAKSMAEEVGGTVRALSQPGKGTSFYFQLPLTLSVVRTLLVEISGKPYAIPLARIDRIITVDRDEITDVENRQYFTFNQQNIGLIAAYQVLELPPTPPKSALSVVVIGDRSNTYGLVVDQFLGERDLVVRPLDPRLGKVPDISATALMGDGSPILIVDVSDLVRSMDTLLKGSKLMKVNAHQNSDLIDRRKRILVVDDSITVREMERKLLENRGYHVDVAVNGVEGWNAVRTQTYDLVISDIDMPRMNGIELVKQIKNHPRLDALPVIIISYRDREEDRLQGLEAGADYYLTKSSFHDETLIDAVVALIGR